MAVAAGSTPEAALENQRLGGLRFRVAALCALVQMCDGYDVNSVAWAVPSLIPDWHLIIFFCSLLNLFLFVYWMPTVLNLIGISPAQAVFAASLRDLGAIFAVLYLGLAIDRIGPERALALHYAAGAVFIAVIALFALPYSVLCVIIFLAGMTIIGSQTGVNGACGKLYPARMRTCGIGWALGIGRLGGIVAPILGGYLLAVGLPPTRIFLVAGLFALIAAAATSLLVFRNTRVASA